MPRFEIELTGFTLNGHTFPPPEGLSELLNKGNAWREWDGDTNIENGYEREIIEKDGKIYTILKKVNSD